MKNLVAGRRQFAYAQLVQRGSAQYDVRKVTPRLMLHTVIGQFNRGV